MQEMGNRKREDEAKVETKKWKRINRETEAEDA